ncbi:MAG: B12-binding domain-containing radical SAM protein [Thermoplasmata archaeon]|uniref:B12-binding domain-containing radical SAM protein n=1 Tax=Candidatus Sysuiplasma superficiale TaxID=2823368 RepID=A0A8J8CDQ9_9ARCH|nr:B12-binding domain-containing radical SAM protein [Candidatus Sysuiplasma superficiale]MBX8643887.1 B12-binding domain-containing radical SAM protein [Candidatus Sysuiplasma superficiale]
MEKLTTVLIRPSNRSGSLYLTKMGFLPVPLGLLQLASSIRTVPGCNVSIIDMEAEELDVESAVERALEMHPQIVGITIHATAAYNNALEIMRRIKENDSSVIVIAGGHHATFLPESIIADGFDIVVLGEGDETIADIARAVKDGTPLESVSGIVLRTGERIVRTEPRKLIEEMDRLPFPAFDLIDREKYRFRTFGKDETVACLETSRGCPYGCDFCSVTPTWGYRRRYKSNRRIIEEMKLVEKLGYGWIFFTDDIFLLPQNLRQRERLFAEMKESGLKLSWIAQMRADAIARNPEFVPLAVESGMKVAALGVESGSREVLKKMRKNIKAADTLKAIEELDRNGVVVLLSFMIGAPYERKRDMLSTMKLSFRLAGKGADVVQFTIYTPLPGTQIFREAVEHDRLFTLDWDRFDFFTPVMKTKVHPVMIQLFQYIGLYSFYIRRYLFDRGGEKVMNMPKRELVPKALEYTQSQMTAYVRDLMAIPQRIISTASLYSSLSSGKLPQDEREHMVSDFRLPVYAEGRRHAEGRVSLQAKT